VTAGVAVLAVAVVRPLAALRASARALTSGDVKARAKACGPEEVASLARGFNEITDAPSARTDEEGQYAGIQITGRDVTEHKRAEEALRESEEHYRQLTDSITDVFFAVDRDLKYTYWNKASEKLTGISAQDAIGKSLYELFPDFKGTEADKLYLEALRTQQPRSLVNQYRLGDKDFFFAINAYPSRTGLSVFVKDISEAKRAEEALRESEEKYRRLVQDSIDGIVIVEGLEVGFMNRAGLKMLGCESEEEVVGRSFIDFVAPEQREMMAERGLAREKGEHVVDRYEFKVLRKDGSEFDAEISVGVITYQGRVARQAIVRDISEHKRAEEALQKARDELESRVERRMQHLNDYGLTFRELAVLHLVAAGESDKEIAAVLGISPLTAHKHLGNILEKMGAACRTEAGVRALREGLLD
jgi:PAS domain S-box-containing protein